MIINTYLNHRQFILNNLFKCKAREDTDVIEVNEGIAIDFSHISKYDFNSLFPFNQYSYAICWSENPMSSNSSTMKFRWSITFTFGLAKSSHYTLILVVRFQLRGFQ